MTPLVDMHCHLFAGLDDGPRTGDEALAMCRAAYAEGVRMVAAVAHQNERWPAVTPARIRAAHHDLGRLLRGAGLPLTAFACAEIMLRPDLPECWARGDLLSVADAGRYLLVEMPYDLLVDLRATAGALARQGVRLILAHPERTAALLHDPGALEGLIRAGCLVQVSSASVTDPRSPEDGRALKGWFRRGLVHLLGSDGHSPSRRPPRLAAAYRRIGDWAGRATADRVAGTNGLAVLQGLPLRVPEPSPARRTWLPGWWPRRRLAGRGAGGEPGP